MTSVEPIMYQTRPDHADSLVSMIDSAARAHSETFQSRIDHIETDLSEINERCKRSRERAEKAKRKLYDAANDIINGGRRKTELHRQLMQHRLVRSVWSEDGELSILTAPIVMKDSSGSKNTCHYLGIMKIVIDEQLDFINIYNVSQDNFNDHPHKSDDVCWGNSWEVFKSLYQEGRGIDIIDHIIDFCASFNYRDEWGYRGVMYPQILAEHYDSRTVKAVPARNDELDNTYYEKISILIEKILDTDSSFYNDLRPVLQYCKAAYSARLHLPSPGVYRGLIKTEIRNLERCQNFRHFSNDLKLALSAVR